MGSVLVTLQRLCHQCFPLSLTQFYEKSFFLKKTPLSLFFLGFRMILWPETLLEPCQTPRMQCFAEIVNNF